MSVYEAQNGHQETRIHRKSSVHQTGAGGLIVWMVCCLAEMKSEAEET